MNDEQPRAGGAPREGKDGDLDGTFPAGTLPPAGTGRGPGGLAGHLIGVMLSPGPADSLADRRAVRDFRAALARFNASPREQRRIRHVIDLIDAEDATYEQALAAVSRGDHAGALPLLRWCAAAGIGESSWLLAVALESTGNTDEAARWYERAADEGDSRAAARLASRHPGHGRGRPARHQCEAPAAARTEAPPGVARLLQALLASPGQGISASRLALVARAGPATTARTIRGLIAAGWLTAAPGQQPRDGGRGERPATRYVLTRRGTGRAEAVLAALEAPVVLAPRLAPGTLVTRGRGRRREPGGLLDTCQP